jgi:hypothetical protein
MEEAEKERQRIQQITTKLDAKKAGEAALQAGLEACQIEFQIYSNWLRYVDFSTRVSFFGGVREWGVIGFWGAKLTPFSVRQSVPNVETRSSPVKGWEERKEKKSKRKERSN